MEPPRYHTMLIEEILLQMDWQSEHSETLRLTAQRLTWPTHDRRRQLK
jgi:hypothetical protein